MCACVCVCGFGASTGCCQDGSRMLQVCGWRDRPHHQAEAHRHTSHCDGWQGVYLLLTPLYFLFLNLNGMKLCTPLYVSISKAGQ